MSQLSLAVLRQKASRIVLLALLDYARLEFTKEGNLVKTENHPNNLGMTPEYTLQNTLRKFLVS